MFDFQYLEDAYIGASDELRGKFKGKFIDAVSREIKDKAKSLLVERSKTLGKGDFGEFRELFDLIREIKAFNNGFKKSNSNVLVPQHVTSVPQLVASVPQEIVVSSARLTTKDNHLAYWTAFQEFVITQDVPFRVRKPQAQHWMNISIGKSNFRLALLANTQSRCIGVQLNCLGDNALNNFKELREKYEMDIKSLSTEIFWDEKEDRKEHHVNIVFENRNPFDKEDWENQHQLLSDWTEKFYNYFRDKIKDIEK